VLDPQQRRTIRASDLHETDYSPWEGWEAQAWPTMTLLRGKIVMENGVLTGDLSDGQWLHRRIADEIIAAPML
jgi:dihydropyrimidinase